MAGGSRYRAIVSLVTSGEGYLGRKDAGQRGWWWWLSGSSERSGEGGGYLRSLCCWAEGGSGYLGR